MNRIAKTKQQARFLADYEEYVRTVLKPTQDVLKRIFREWKQPDYWRRTDLHSRRPAPTPVQRALTRVKRPESVLDKIYRKPDSFPNGLSRDSMLAMHDTLAGRIVTYFLSGFPIIDRELHSNSDIEIVDEDPPVAYLDPRLLSRLGMSHLDSQYKESGYASIHYIVKVRIPGMEPSKRPCVEIQVRTLAEDIWGEVEHLLGYKPNKKTSFAVRKQFEIIASQLAAIDEHFNFLYDELLRFQEEVEIADEDPLNAENLPAVLAEVGTGCAQREIDGLLKLLVSRSIRTIRDLRTAAAGNVVEVIRHTYRNHEGRDPVNFEVVACLAAVGLSHEPAEVEDIVRAQIDYLKGWEALKKEIR
ncbi:hypothetical protein Thimo_2310 [Thioflavicoccus mobilis 8321]|uniref:RelA/SpoT domain-containing protein n=1 Tax=Thioflavicoccus mobilis 8321 TaxID=765912 RepID=L0GYZ2_9GAMM|nr:hypothetical protein [Thioflavicoccus mobilis]AGA91052.1 hypothetical protein Thimo_2310 [Thioflavicoccus mobilis 8321]